MVTDTGQRADAALVGRGLARSRAQAAQLIRQGHVSAWEPEKSQHSDGQYSQAQGQAGQVKDLLGGEQQGEELQGQLVRKPSMMVKDQMVLQVSTKAQISDYASRGGIKLAGALAELDQQGVSLGIAGSFCLDLGASTGGFTDVLLRAGAGQVLAVDVGHSQLITRLRDDSRVLVMEGMNVRDLTRQHLPSLAQVVVGDLSFISLTLVLPVVAQLLAPGGQALLLVKPQFEVGKEKLGSGGVVSDVRLQHEAVDQVIHSAGLVGLQADRVIPSSLPGTHGNREYFVLFTQAEHPSIMSVHGSQLQGQGEETV